MNTIKFPYEIYTFGSDGELSVTCLFKTRKSRWSSDFCTVYCELEKPQRMCPMEQTPSRSITEGLVTVFVQESNEGNIFYNPAQVLNRDLSLVVLYSFGKEFRERDSKSFCHSEGQSVQGPCKSLRILEPLAASGNSGCLSMPYPKFSGLRSLRYAIELKSLVDYIVASDLDKNAARTIERNREMNHVDSTSFKSVHCEANQIMQLSRFFSIDTCLNLFESSVSPMSMDKQPSSSINQTSSLHFNVIDLDPYGSVASFLDAAVCAISDGGILCLTSTDMPVLCGNNPEVSFYKYGGIALKAPYMHEMSLRLLLHAVMEAASRYKRIVEPLLCCSIDFYVRCFVRVRTSASECKGNASHTSFVLQCSSCPAFTIVPLGLQNEMNHKIKFKTSYIMLTNGCEQCGEPKFHIGGPFYSAELYNKNFVKSCLNLVNDETVLPGLTMRPKLRGLLTLILDELHDIPLYYHLPSIMSFLKSETMKLKDLKYTLTHMGYRVSHFHRCPQSIKTTAPPTVLFDLIRRWVQEHPRKSTDPCPFLKKTIITPSCLLLSAPTSTVTSSRIPCWLPNPTPGWGPKKRAKLLPH